MSTETGLELRVETRLPVGAAIGNRLHPLRVFLRDAVLPAIPSEILGWIGSAKIEIVIADEIGAPADGLFVPPGEWGATRAEIRLRASVLSGPDWRPLVAHEFFHAIHFLLNPGEEAWVREGLAQNFEHHVLQQFNGVNVAAAFRDPGTPLRGDYDLTRPNPSQYGHNLLYFYYLQEQCGGRSLFWRIAAGSAGAASVRGSAAIDEILRARTGTREQCSGFEQSARHFEVARIHNKIVYAAGDRSKVFYLMASALPGPVPRSSVTASEVAALPSYAPLLLRADAELPRRLPPGAERYWVLRRYPYSVQTEAPAQIDGDWVQVFFRR